ncbi:unnamed protein product [Symbiodinium natans]|uniref:Uncharacterized protein n=1 Tax=Symbiodinium natans TaxID=878477 RepID=A0A812TL38_9DINO|nr:unnamed protein product [Symbiodinium natans]
MSEEDGSDAVTDEVWQEDGSSEQDNEEEADNSRLATFAEGETEPLALESLGLEKYAAVDDSTFDDFELPESIATQVQETWTAFCAKFDSREAAGEMFFTSLFDAAPSLQLLFKSPKAVVAMRFMRGVSSCIACASQKVLLKKEIESLGFRHLEIEVTSVRVDFFREALLDLLEETLDTGHLTSGVRAGFQALINYAGGAFIYIRREYAGRISVILRSWAIASKGSNSNEAEALLAEEEGEEGVEEADKEKETNANDTKQDNHAKTAKGPANLSGARSSGEAAGDQMKVPTTFNEMLLFNASVMGFGSSTWMNIILAQFENMVLNVANSSRLQEECDVVSLVLAKYKGPINLPDFKSVTLASLRSLLPEDWDSNHEIAWSWLWENIEGLLSAMIGKPRQQEHALSNFFRYMEEKDSQRLTQRLFPVFFELAPAGQDFFQQSATRMHFISGRIISMTLDMYAAPRKMVEEISAIGLRHVGYAIPVEMFPPFVSAAVALLQELATNELAIEAFRWSLALISKILVRAISEGSTLVMKAINTNQRLMLNKAMEVVSRGHRASELLSIAVGTQSISPFYWAIDSGATVCAVAMLEDLLTIRADRDVYYYGCETLFTRHPEVIQRLCATAPTLMPTLLDGLVWRSRQTKEGLRRVNYYVKHLIQDLEGNYSMNLEWLVAHGDPKIIRHPTVVMFADLLWYRLASYKFVVSKLYFLLMLLIFVTSQAILPNHTGEAQSREELVVIFTLRILNYLGMMCKLIFGTMRKTCSDCTNGNLDKSGCIPIPAYLFSTQEFANFILMWLLIISCAQEPFFLCLIFSQTGPDGFPLTPTCQGAEDTIVSYSITTFLAMMIYWALLLDLAIFSMRISAYVLVCGRMLGEVALFLCAIFALVLAFATSISALYFEYPSIEGAHLWGDVLLQMALEIFPEEKYLEIAASSVVVFVPVVTFVFVVSILLMNLLIAQLTQSYHDAFSNMQGYARLNRAAITSNTLHSLSRKRWSAFLTALGMDKPLEFNEGDVGLAGGIQVLESASVHPVFEDTIKRYGGSTASDAPWPREVAEEEDDRMAKLERTLSKIVKSQGKTRQRGGRASSSMGGSTASRSVDEGDD